MDSSRTPDRETTPDIRHYIADKLNGAIFSGWYTERIWIDDLKHYRDHIKIDEDEVQTNKILRSVSRRVRKLRPKFTGIEGKPILILQSLLTFFKLDCLTVFRFTYTVLPNVNYRKNPCPDVKLDHLQR